MAPRYWYPAGDAGGAGASEQGGAGAARDGDAGPGAGADADGGANSAADGGADVDADGSKGEVVRGWRVRIFDQDSPVYAHRPVCHVSWYEAQAYCR